jgi:hypothetical protein
MDKEDLQATIHKISGHLINFWDNIGIDRPINHTQIVYHIYNDLKGTINIEWNYNDILIGFRRWIEMFNATGRNS